MVGESILSSASASFPAGQIYNRGPALQAVRAYMYIQILTGEPSVEPVRSFFSKHCTGFASRGARTQASPVPLLLHLAPAVVSRFHMLASRARTIHPACTDREEPARGSL